jgi:8-oxo-dGTP diphosphatase
MINSTLCYLRNSDKTLMLYRNKKDFDIHEGKWNGLGGKIEPGESPDECIIREVKEESGYDIFKPALKGFITFPKFDKINDWLVFIYICEEYKGEMIESNEGTLKWVKNNELLNLNLWEGDKVFMPWLDNNKFFSAKFIYKNSSFKDYSVNFY